MLSFDFLFMGKLCYFDIPSYIKCNVIEIVGGVRFEYRIEPMCQVRGCGGPIPTLVLTQCIMKARE